ncbi:MAG TPA: hypothetical protein VF176_10640 [Solirubrobacterales bacterium]
MPLSDIDNCLFCGRALTDETRTREDVFPKWLQREYDLSELTLTLLNGSEIKYGRLTVPACGACNNVHASQLENRVKQGAASDQEVWMWLLKLQLGTMAFETSRRWVEDRRDPLSSEPIVDASTLDLGFLHGLFDTLKVDDPQYAPEPLGTIISFPRGHPDFFYSDRLYRHPASQLDNEYSASCICFHGRCWIALYDDAGNVRRGLDLKRMTAGVEKGLDPVLFLPELMYLRSRLDYMPRTMILGPSDGPAAGVMIVPPMFHVSVLDHDEKVLQMFQEALPGGVDGENYDEASYS